MKTRNSNRNGLLPVRWAAFAAAIAFSAPLARATAQSLGPQRQFLSVEPYYESTKFDNAVGGSQFVSGYGGRLWINGAPFHFPRNSSIALFFSVSPETNKTLSKTVHYGGQVDQFLFRRPLGALIDPFVSVGVGGYRVSSSVAGAASQTKLALTPGGGIRIPIPNRLQLRFDARDLLLMNVLDATGKKTTSNHLLLQGGIGITF